VIEEEAFLNSSFMPDPTDSLEWMGSVFLE
jgi:hypothetical protein